MWCLSLVVMSFISLDAAFGGFEHLTQSISECQSQCQIEEKIVNSVDMELLSKNEDFKEFLVCVAKKEDFMDQNGIGQIDVIKSFLNDQNTTSIDVDKLVSKCAVQMYTPNETAFAFFKCVYNEF